MDECGAILYRLRRYVAEKVNLSCTFFSLHAVVTGLLRNEFYTVLDGSLTKNTDLFCDKANNKFKKIQ